MSNRRSASLRTTSLKTSLAVLICTAGTAFGQIANQSEDFADGNFLDDTALLAAGYTFSDAGGLDTTQVRGDADGGDGINDGGIFIDGAAIEGSVSFPFAGTIENGVEYRFGAQLFQSATSFVQAEVELLAGSTVVASLPFGEVGISGSGPPTNPGDPAGTASGTFPATLYYQGDAGTAGQTLSFRVKQTRGFNNSFDVGIDNWELETVDLSTPIADQSDTITGFASLGYEWTVPANYLELPSDSATPADGAFPGDGAVDGAIIVDGNNGGPPQSVVEYRFDGAIEDGQQYDFSAYLFQATSSFALTTVELIADPGGPSETVVASSDPDVAVFASPTHPSGLLFNLVEVSYEGDATTAGQGLAFRISSDRPAGGSSSEVGIDGWSLALSTGLDGDYDGDGMVTAADYSLWRSTVGATGPDLPTDGNSNGEVDIADYSVWQVNFGSPAPALAAAAVVPEPSCVCLLLSASAFLTRMRFSGVRAATAAC